MLPPRNYSANMRYLFYLGNLVLNPDFVIRSKPNHTLTPAEVVGNVSKRVDKIHINRGGYSIR